MQIKIPRLAYVVLIGTTSCGKSTFAKKNFLPTEVISSDFCRSLITDNENDLTITKDAFELLHFISRKRLAAGKLTVVDATNVQKEARKPLIEIAREFHCIPVAIVFDISERVCQDRNKSRSDRNLGPHVIKNQSAQLHQSMRHLKQEGFRHIFTIKSEEEANSVEIVREPLWNDQSDMHGPFDIIGDIHGCYDELLSLFEKLGYITNRQNPDTAMGGPIYEHPEGRTAVFLGDIVDRGPKIVETIKLVYNMVKAGKALCVPGNHDIKLMRRLNGKDVQVVHGLAESMAQIDALPDNIRDSFKIESAKFIDDMVSHYVLDSGNLVVAHAGLKQEMQGRGSGKVREFCLFGETTGEIDEFGLPVRYNWAAEYRGNATVIYGHTPIPAPEWLNKTLNIDTGCVFGGKLTAFRYPEKTLVSEPAKKEYCVSVKPIQKAITGEIELTAQQKFDDLLDAEDVIGKRFITTRLRQSVTIREENAIAALEVMSRYAINPKWLIYLPPTMSPSETSAKEGYLEYPDEAFAYFRTNGIERVICQKKHMGSRAIVIVCKDEASATKRFGTINEGIGVVYTRTGRQFFTDNNIQKVFLEKVRVALEKINFWNEFKTDWVCLDCELMPWSEKAQELLKGQYAATGRAATVSLEEAIKVLEETALRTDLETNFDIPANSTTREFNVQKLLTKFKARYESISKYITAYRQYCWPVKTIDDLKLAPFHIMATEGKVHTDKNHEWHMSMAEKICSTGEPILLSTPFKVIHVSNADEVKAGSTWWEELTGKGGEGMVVKPLDFISFGKKGLMQPALKCRGREYLRIIYGPEYTQKDHLERLRSRAVQTKRSLALREFALGLESLERFVSKEPLRKIHECAFGVLALESEPVDPRL